MNPIDINALRAFTLSEHYPVVRQLIETLIAYYKDRACAEQKDIDIFKRIGSVAGLSKLLVDLDRLKSPKVTTKVDLTNK